MAHFPTERLPSPDGASVLSHAEVVDSAVLAERRARRHGAPPAPVPPPAAPGEVWTAPPGIAIDPQWRERRAELERQLARAAEALAAAREGERTEREAVRAALAGAQADLRAARAARDAEAASIVVLTGELEAERAAHAVTRARVASLAEALQSAREELRAARQTRAGETDTLVARVAELDRDAAGLRDQVELERRAREQAEAAAAATRRPAEQTGRLVADLDAAAASLRRAADPPVAAPPREPAALARGPRHLRRALVALAREDPSAAGELLVALAPAQGAAVEGPLAYDLTVRELGTFAVGVGNGAARVRRLAQPRPRKEARFHLDADALTLTELLAGEPRKLGRIGPRPKLKGRRRRAAALHALGQSELSLAQAAAAGARLDPALVYRLLPFAVDPAWTRGSVFTVAQAIAERTWYVSARDGAPLRVSEDAPPTPPDATVTMTAAAFEHLLRGEPPEHGARPIVRGDHDAVAALKAWTDRARGA